MCSWMNGMDHIRSGGLGLCDLTFLSRVGVHTLVWGPSPHGKATASPASPCSNGPGPVVCPMTGLAFYFSGFPFLCSFWTKLIYLPRVAIKMAMNRSFKLNSGYSIPAVGLGTWQSGPNEVKEAVTEALRVGYRHINAAAVYSNEAKVGQGIKASGVDRKEIFVRYPSKILTNTTDASIDYREALEYTSQTRRCRTRSCFHLERSLDRLS
jgi:hypothetical protein